MAMQPQTQEVMQQGMMQQPQVHGMSQQGVTVQQPQVHGMTQQGMLQQSQMHTIVQPGPQMQGMMFGMAPQPPMQGVVHQPQAQGLMQQLPLQGVMQHPQTDMFFSQQPQMQGMMLAIPQQSQTRVVLAQSTAGYNKGENARISTSTGVLGRLGKSRLQQIAAAIGFEGTFTCDMSEYTLAQLIYTYANQRPHSEIRYMRCDTYDELAAKIADKCQSTRKIVGESNMEKLTHYILSEGGSAKAIETVAQTRGWQDLWWSLCFMKKKDRIAADPAQAGLSGNSRGGGPLALTDGLQTPQPLALADRLAEFHTGAQLTPFVQSPQGGATQYGALQTPSPQPQVSPRLDLRSPAPHTPPRSPAPHTPPQALRSQCLSLEDRGCTPQDHFRKLEMPQPQQSLVSPIRLHPLGSVEAEAGQGELRATVATLAQVRSAQVLGAGALAALQRVAAGEQEMNAATVTVDTALGRNRHGSAGDLCNVALDASQLAAAAAGEEELSDAAVVGDPALGANHHGSVGDFSTHETGASELAEAAAAASDEEEPSSTSSRRSEGGIVPMPFSARIKANRERAMAKRAAKRRCQRRDQGDLNSVGASSTNEEGVVVAGGVGDIAPIDVTTNRPGVEVLAPAFEVATGAEGAAGPAETNSAMGPAVANEAAGVLDRVGRLADGQSQPSMH